MGVLGDQDNGVHGRAHRAAGQQTSLSIEQDRGCEALSNPCMCQGCVADRSRWQRSSHPGLALEHVVDIGRYGCRARDRPRREPVFQRPLLMPMSPLYHQGDHKQGYGQAQPHEYHSE